MLRYFVEKSDQSYEKVLKIREKMDKYLDENVSFFGFFQKITCLKLCGVLN